MGQHRLRSTRITGLHAVILLLAFFNWSCYVNALNSDYFNAQADKDAIVLLKGDRVVPALPVEYGMPNRKTAAGGTYQDISRRCRANVMKILVIVAAAIIFLVFRCAFLSLTGEQQSSKSRFLAVGDEEAGDECGANFSDDAESRSGQEGDSGSADEGLEDPLLAAARMQVEHLVVSSGALFPAIRYMPTGQAAALVAALTKLTLQEIAALSTVVPPDLSPRITNAVNVQYLLIRKVEKMMNFDPLGEATRKCIRSRFCLQSELSKPYEPAIQEEEAWRKRLGQAITSCCVVTYWVKVTTTMLHRTCLSAGGVPPHLLQALLPRLQLMAATRNAQIKDCPVVGHRLKRCEEIIASPFCREEVGTPPRMPYAPVDLEAEVRSLEKIFADIFPRSVPAPWETARAAAYHPNVPVAPGIRAAMDTLKSLGSGWGSQQAYANAHGLEPQWTPYLAEQPHTVPLTDEAPPGAFPQPLQEMPAPPRFAHPEDPALEQFFFAHRGGAHPGYGMPARAPPPQGPWFPIHGQPPSGGPQTHQPPSQMHPPVLSETHSGITPAYPPQPAAPAGFEDTTVEGILPQQLHAGAPFQGGQLAQFGVAPHGAPTGMPAPTPHGYPPYFFSPHGNPPAPYPATEHGSQYAWGPYHPQIPQADFSYQAQPHLPPPVHAGPIPPEERAAPTQQPLPWPPLMPVWESTLPLLAVPAALPEIPGFLHIDDAMGPVELSGPPLAETPGLLFTAEDPEGLEALLQPFASWASASGPPLASSQTSGPGTPPLSQAAESQMLDSVAGAGSSSVSRSDEGAERAGPQTHGEHDE